MIAFLTMGPVFDYEAGLYGILIDGGLLCRRGDQAPLECPALDDISGNHSPSGPYRQQIWRASGSPELTGCPSPTTTHG